MGQDLLNLFFTTFNKYVGKSDKNQAFTPVHFMCQVEALIEIAMYWTMLRKRCF